MRYEGIVLYSDYDGTLTNVDGVLHRENIEAIERFEREGGRFSLATGKTLSDYEQMPFTVNAPAIFANGAELFDPVTGAWVRRTMLPPSALELFREVYDAFPQAGINAHAIDGLHCYRGCPSVVNLDDASWFDGFSGLETLDGLDGNLTMLTVYGEDEDIEKVRDLIARKYDDLCATISYPRFLNVMARGISKGSGLEYVRRHCLDDEKLYLAVGDGENDLDLLLRADVSFVIGGSFPSLLMAADVVLEDNGFASIPQIISYIDNVLLGNKSVER